MKKLPIILFVSCVALLAAWGRPKKEVNHFPVAPSALYQSDNELYFDNKLPRDVEVVAAEAPDNGTNGNYYLGETEHQPGTHYYKIFISPTYNLFPQDERETVLHESCHVYVNEAREARGQGFVDYDPHGPEWQDCMLTLAKRGALADLW